MPRKAATHAGWALGVGSGPEPVELLVSVRLWWTSGGGGSWGLRSSRADVEGRLAASDLRSQLARVIGLWMWLWDFSAKARRGLVLP